MSVAGPERFATGVLRSKSLLSAWMRRDLLGCDQARCCQTRRLPQQTKLSTSRLVT